MSLTQSAAVIDDDRPCIHCGYNLRSLSTDGLCPECGSPVAHSFRGWHLRHADPAWLDRIHLGAALRLWSITAGLVAMICIAILTMLGMSGLAMPMGWLMPPIAIVLLLSAVLSVGAAFVITAREPVTFLGHEGAFLRDVIRIAAVLTLLSGAVTLMGLGELARSIARKLSMFFGVFVWTAELIYIRRLARRIPDPDLTRQTTTVFWGISVSIGLIVADSVATRFTGGAAPGGGAGGRVFRVLTCSGSIGFIGALVFFTRYANLLTGYRAAFRTAAEQSRAR